MSALFLSLIAVFQLAACIGLLIEGKPWPGLMLFSWSLGGFAALMMTR
jgi:hypothetical protein